jgi:hypothetical protein
VFFENGIAERKAAAERVEVLREDLIVPPQKDDRCLFHYGSHFVYCRYKDIGAKRTIALLGDSHAYQPFPAVSEYMAGKGHNTLVLGAGGAGNPVNGKVADPVITEKLFEILEADKKIHRVFLVTRGVLYIHGIDHDYSQYIGDGKAGFYGNASGLASATQSTIDRLNRIGKTVYVVAENPVWPGMGQGNDPQYIRALVKVQPLLDYFKPVRKEIHLYKKDVLEHQKEYLEMLKNLKGATIIQSIDAFCPTDECLLFNDEGLPLYWDDDHISQRTGGRFLVEKVLKPYLDG